MVVVNIKNEEEDDELTDEIEDLADMESGAIACS